MSDDARYPISPDDVRIDFDSGINDDATIGRCECCEQEVFMRDRDYYNAPPRFVEHLGPCEQRCVGSNCSPFVARELRQRLPREQVDREHHLTGNCTFCWAAKVAAFNFSRR